MSLPPSLPSSPLPYRARTSWSDVLAENPYARFVRVFEGSRDWARLGNPSFEWPGMDSLALTGAALGTGDRGRQDVDAPIVMSRIRAGQVVAEVGGWVRQAYQAAITPDNVLRSPSNGAAKPALMPMRSDEKKFDSRCDKGECWALAMASSQREPLTRRTDLFNHTRPAPVHFSMPGAAGNKQYAYQSVALAAAYMQHEGLIDGLPYTMEQVHQVTQGKRSTSMTILHRCGNAFCLNPFHFGIDSKEANDEEEFCHHFLRKSRTYEEYSHVQRTCSIFHCPNGNMCFTNVYDLEALAAEDLTLTRIPEDEEDE